MQEKQPEGFEHQC